MFPPIYINKLQEKLSDGDPDEEIQIYSHSHTNFFIGTDIY